MFLRLERGKTPFVFKEFTSNTDTFRTLFPDSIYPYTLEDMELPPSFLQLFCRSTPRLLLFPFFAKGYWEICFALARIQMKMIMTDETARVRVTLIYKKIKKGWLRGNIGILFLQEHWIEEIKYDYDVIRTGDISNRLAWLKSGQNVSGN